MAEVGQYIPVDLDANNRRDREACCDNCRRTFPVSQLAQPKDLAERVDPGGEVPAGECPECGALAYRTFGWGVCLHGHGLLSLPQLSERQACDLANQLNAGTQQWTVCGIYCRNGQRFAETFDAPHAAAAEVAAQEWAAERSSRGCYIAAVIPGEVRIAA